MTGDEEDVDLEEVEERLLGHIPDGISPKAATELFREIRNFIVEEDTWELAPILEHESYLVLGSYDIETGEKQRLRAVADLLDSSDDRYGFLLEDIELRKDSPGMSRYKFKLIADYSDYLVGVFEREYGGETHEVTFMVEYYLSSSHIFVRESNQSGTEIEYGWMTEGVFRDFDAADRLHYWVDETELLKSVHRVLL